jgi:hypothetical protein
MSTEIIAKLDKAIGEELRVILLAANKSEKDFVATAKLILDDYRRDPTGKPLKENLLIALVKSAIQSQTIRPADVSNRTKELIKTLGLEEDDRRFMYECLFDNGGIEGPGLRVWRR